MPGGKSSPRTFVRYFQGFWWKRDECGLHHFTRVGCGPGLVESGLTFGPDGFEVELGGKKFQFKYEEGERG